SELFHFDEGFRRITLGLANKYVAKACVAKKKRYIMIKTNGITFKPSTCQLFLSAILASEHHWCSEL
ncbi:hypothetical protein V1951_09040, partial [Yersinia sp. 2544 StPb PI]|uniref:hypothetical protein n=1 Tax=Yersinia sp. 2544 StPb PI TaxID=3117409 RepID=UPI003B287F99